MSHRCRSISVGALDVDATDRVAAFSRSVLFAGTRSRPIPVGCLALLSLIAFLGVVALAGALRMVGAIKSGLGLGSADGNRDPWHGMVGDAHPLDFVEGQH